MSNKQNYLTSKQVLKELDIKPQTLYAYVSRGWIKSIADPNTRGRLYLKSDIDKLQIRKRARSGHAVAAASAIHFGDPVLESSIAEILENTVHYRNYDLFTDLADQNVPFENVAELLWSGTLILQPIRWESALSSAETKRWNIAYEQARAQGESKHRIAAMISQLTLLDVREPDPRADQTLKMARELYLYLAALTAPQSGAEKISRSIVETLCGGFKLTSPDARKIINSILVACAEHELNTASFVARAAAANGADTLLCLEAAYATFRGTQQAYQVYAVEAWNHKLHSQKLSDQDLHQILEAHIQSEGKLDGFGHPLYKDGDPRARYLLNLGRNSAGNLKAVSSLERAIQWMKVQYGEEPNLDVALVYLTRLLGLPDKTASTLFSLARFSGWIAHILEQRVLGTPIRPRAKFVRATS